MMLMLLLMLYQFPETSIPFLYYQQTTSYYQHSLSSIFSVHIFSTISHRSCKSFVNNFFYNCDDLVIGKPKKHYKFCQKLIYHTS